MRRKRKNPPCCPEFPCVPQKRPEGLSASLDGGWVLWDEVVLRQRCQLLGHTCRLGRLPACAWLQRVITQSLPDPSSLYHDCTGMSTPRIASSRGTSPWLHGQPPLARPVSAAPLGLPSSETDASCAKRADEVSRIVRPVASGWVAPERTSVADIGNSRNGFKHEFKDVRLAQTGDSWYPPTESPVTGSDRQPVADFAGLPKGE
jgi:hypothetical protein